MLNFFSHGLNLILCKIIFLILYLHNFHNFPPKTHLKQECIPVGCVPPVCYPYLPACTAQGLYLVQGGVPGLGGTWSGGRTWSGRCTWSEGCTWPGGMYLVRGVPGLGVYLVPGVYLVRGVSGPGGCTCPGTRPL